MTMALPGRAEELDQLRSALDEVAAGAGGLLLVTGEIGAGKTALADAVSNDLHGGWFVRWGRCWAGADAPPLWPWLQALRGAPGELDDQQVLRARLRELSDQLSAGPALTEPGPAVAAAAALLEQALVDHGRRCPLLVILDDLELADPHTLAALELLAPRLRTEPVLVLATVRDGGSGPAIGEGLRREAVHLPLPPLDVTATASVLEQEAGTRPSAALASQVQLLTAGNPLLIAELARAIGAGGEHTARAGGHSSLEHPPEELRQVVRRWVAPLPAATEALLEVASVMARQTTVELLGAVAEEEVERVRSDLDPALGRGILQVQGDILSFRHPIVRKALYYDLSPERRLRLHARAAQVIDSVAASPALVAEAAHHAFHAESVEGAGDAADHATQAAVEALAAGAVEEALSLLSHVLTWAESQRAPAALRARILTELAAGQDQAGLHSQAEQSWAQATSLASAARDAEALARAAVGRSRSSLLLGVSNAAHIRALEEALALLGPDPSALRAAVLANLAAALYWSPERSRSIELCEEAERVAEEDGGPAARAAALAARHYTTRGSQDVEERIRVARQVVEAAEESGQRDLEITGRAALLVDLRERGDSSAVLEASSDLREAAERYGHLTARWATWVHEMVSALSEGRFDDADAIDATLRAAAAGARDLELLRAFARAATDLRPPTPAEKELRRNLAAAHPDVLTWRCIAAFDVCAGDPDRARGEVAELLALLTGPARSDAHWLLATALTAECAAALGDATLARPLLRLLERHRDRLAVGGRVGACRGAIAHHVAALSLVCGHAADAVEHARAAVEQHSRPGLAAHLPRSLLVLGSALSAVGAADEAAEALARARSGATDLGLVDVAEAAGAQLHPPAAAVAVLSRRGDYWSISREGRTVSLADLKGLHYLARLVSMPNRPLHVTELVRETDPAADRFPATGHGGSDAMLDDTARRSFRAQVNLLEGERARALALRDQHRAESIEREIGAIKDVLAKGTGLGGRDRRLPSESERARVRVTKALRFALARVAEADPRLGGHLAATVRTGAHCSYEPHGPIVLTWRP
jgi:tetratricopeptide (TPR) repeat protein